MTLKLRDVCYLLTIFMLIVFSIGEIYGRKNYVSDYNGRYDTEEVKGYVKEHNVSKDDMIDYYMDNHK